MNEPSTPAEVGSNTGLGPLPEARWKWAGNGPRPYEDAYSADQMLAYAAQEVAAERERIAQALEADTLAERQSIAHLCDGLPACRFAAIARKA